MKKNNFMLPVCVGIAVLGCLLAVYANLNSAKLNKTVDGERYKRITAEQQLQKAQQQIAALQTELGESQSKMKSIEKILNDGQEIKAELDAVKKDREMLKQQIEALTSAAAATAAE